MTDMNIINRRLEISDELIENILVTAFEGGSTYWAKWANIADKKDAKKVACFTSEYLTRTKKKDAKLIIWTDDDDKIEITKKSIIDALQQIDSEYPETLNRILNEEYDADDTDIVLQMACFKEIVFG